MSIIIKGMDMPKEDGRVLKIFPDGRVAINLNDNVAKAVEIPPHGRLIDADALRQDLKDSIDECQNWADAVEPDTTMYARISQAFGAFVECSLRVKAAPTIIEAEEAEE